MEEWIRTSLIVMAFIAVASVIWTAARWTSRVDSDITSLKEFGEGIRDAIKELKDDFKELRAAFEQIRGEMGQIRGEMKQIRSENREIRGDIKQIFSRLPAQFVDTHSPLRLTDLGETVAERMGARSWASELAESLIGEVKGQEPFEIDEFCNRYVRTRLDELWERKVAANAYEFGTERDTILSILRVVLREVLLRRSAQ